MMCRLRRLGPAGVLLGAMALVGCQTQMAGMTLPSSHYLEHYPQYFPADPDFPLPKELARQEEYAGLSRPGEAAGADVNPVGPLNK